jgi:two-component system sensor histidine kinase GlrK
MNIRRWFRPRSILRLILSGFTLSLGIVFLAFGLLLFFVDRLAEQNRIIATQAVVATHDGRLLISKITAMERSALQYLVLRDQQLLDVYMEAHETFDDVTARLNSLSLNADQRTTLEQLEQIEQDLFQEFGSPYAMATGSEKPIAWFGRALQLARDFLGQSMTWVDIELKQLQSTVDQTVIIMTWITIVVVLVVFVLAGIFATLIMRPLHLMAKAIHQLGSGDFVSPIAIPGPSDLEDLGERLNWLRKQLSEFEQQKARFLRQVSHELKTPLTALREGAELLADQVVGMLNGEQSEVVDIMRENSLRLQRQIEDLLNFNQALFRNLELHPEHVEVASLINDVIDSQRLAWKAKNIIINKELESIELLIDREKFGTIVDNLLSNAIKFSPLWGSICLEFKVKEDRALLEIQDSGPGFHKEDGERVFEAFYQGAATTDSSVKGSGLGLAIAREYALALGGNLQIVNCRTRGGIVRLSIPLHNTSG